VPLAGFPNLSAAFILSPPSRHFQTGGVRGVPPFREFILPRILDDSSPPTCPLDVPPIELALIPVLGGPSVVTIQKDRSLSFPDSEFPPFR
jgi:hypothetical protein